MSPFRRIDPFALRQYVHRPTEVTAVKWDGTPAGATPVIEWILSAGGNAIWHEAYPDIEVQVSPVEFMKLPAEPAGIFLQTKDGRLRVGPGDYVIRGTEGEFYPCDYEVFQKIYLPLESLGYSRSSFDRYEQVIHEALGEASSLRSIHGILNDTLLDRLGNRLVHSARAEIYQKLADFIGTQADAGEMISVADVVTTLQRLATEDRKAALGHARS